MRCDLGIIPSLGFGDVAIEVVDGMESRALNVVEGELSFFGGLQELNPE